MVDLAIFAMSVVIGGIIGLTLVGFLAYGIGWEQGWDDSKEFIYELLNTMDDDDVLITVRHRRRT